MNKEQLTRLLKKIELCSSVFVDNEMHMLDYTIIDSVHPKDTAFGYSHVDTGEEYIVTRDELATATFVGNAMIIDEVEYVFKSLTTTCIDPERVEFTYKNTFNREEILTEVNNFMQEYDLVDEEGLLKLLVEDRAAGGLEDSTSILDIIHGANPRNEWGSFFKEKVPPEWIFTFGSNHIGEIDGCLYGKYMVVKGTFNSAREIINQYAGNAFAFQYASRDDAGVKKYNMQEVQLQKVTRDE